MAHSRTNTHIHTPISARVCVSVCQFNSILYVEQKNNTVGGDWRAQERGHSHCRRCRRQRRQRRSSSSSAQQKNSGRARIPDAHIAEHCGTNASHVRVCDGGARGSMSERESQ